MLSLLCTFVLIYGLTFKGKSHFSHFCLLINGPTLTWREVFKNSPEGSVFDQEVVRLFLLILEWDYRNNIDRTCRRHNLEAKVIHWLLKPESKRILVAWDNGTDLFIQGFISKNYQVPMICQELRVFSSKPGRQGP